VEYIPRNYVPRERVNKAHVLAIFGNWWKYSQQELTEEVAKIQKLKDLFLKFARANVMKGYVGVANQLGWRLDGQLVETFKDIRAYIAQSVWDEKFKKGYSFYNLQKV